MKQKRNNSHRTARVSMLINNAIMEVLRKGKMLDSRLLGCPITITKVEVTGDLQIAKCFFLPFNTKMTKEVLLDALEKSKYAIRNFVTQEVRLRFSPELRFFYDYDFEYAADVLTKLESIKALESTSTSEIEILKDSEE